ncbi:MAG: hypothetical protein KIH80_005310 [Flavobacteriia bacterium]|nr:hypothetical protein [Flavobacteriia bacterium]
MSNLKEVVGSLEDKVSKLVHHLEGVKKENFKLSDDIANKEKAFEKAKHDASYWEEKYNALQMAQSMVGSEQNTTEAKLKINTLIKELDYCIGALSK